MPDWIVPVSTCAAIVLLLFVAQRFDDRSESAKRAGTEPDPHSRETSDDEAAPATTTKHADESGPHSHGASPDSVKSVRVEAKPAEKPAAAAPLPKLEYEEDEDVDPTKVGSNVASPKKAVTPPTKKIIYDEDAATEDPTKPGALILVTATAQTDKGSRRKRNEDNLLVMEDPGVFVVADGMGGYRGGEIASELAVKTIEGAFREKAFLGDAHESIPKRASDLARAIQMANEAILAHAGTDKKLEGMGTTICAARFSPNKQRLYVAHVGDSRMYRMRDGTLRQMTSDHTMKDFGVKGPGSEHLSRAVGVWPTVPIDIVLAKPNPGDLYLICSDGLTKMLDDEAISEVLARREKPSELVAELVRKANEEGGRDNITAILIRVHAPQDPALRS